MIRTGSDRIALRQSRLAERLISGSVIDDKNLDTPRDRVERCLVQTLNAGLNVVFVVVERDNHGNRRRIATAERVVIAHPYGFLTAFFRFCLERETLGEAAAAFPDRLDDPRLFDRRHVR